MTEPQPLTSERLAEAADLLRTESSVAFYSHRAKETMLLLLEQAQRAGRYRIAWRFARQRALATGWAADRSGERARELQTAVQDGYFALIALQMVRREMGDDLEKLLGDYEAGEITSLQLCTNAAHMIRSWRESAPLPDRCPSNVPTGYGDDRAYWCALHIAHDVPLHQDREGHVWTEQDAEERRPGRHIRDEKDTREGESTLPKCPVCSHPPCHCSCFGKEPDRLCPHRGESAAAGGDAR